MLPIATNGYIQEVLFTLEMLNKYYVMCVKSLETRDDPGIIVI